MGMLPFPFEVYVPGFDERKYEAEIRARHPHIGVEELIYEVARGKAQKAYEELREKRGQTGAQEVRIPADEARVRGNNFGSMNAADEGILVLAADTVVVLDGEVFGKGEDREKSLAMLKRLNGRMHEVISAVCILGDAEGGAAENHVCEGCVAGSIAAGRPIGAAEICEGRVIEERISEVSKVYFAQSETALLEQYVDLYRPYDKAGAYGIQDGGALLVEKIEGNFHNIMGLPIRPVFQALSTLFTDF